MVVVVQLTLLITSFEFIECFTSLGFASLMFAFALAKDVNDYLYQIDKDIKSRKSRTKIMAQLSAFIQFTNLRGFDLFSIIYVNTD